jgi:phosphoglycolate phosphatase-like HAD superfamily hydrolase
MVLGYDDNRQKGVGHFSELIRAYELSHDEVLYIGDSINDYVFSKRSKVHFVGKTGVFSKKDFREVDEKIVTIDNLAELKEIL